jgi:hypothetical protein
MVYFLKMSIIIYGDPFTYMNKSSAVTLDLPIALILNSCESKSNLFRTKPLWPLALLKAMMMSGLSFCSLLKTKSPN